MKQVSLQLLTIASLATGSAFALEPGDDAPKFKLKGSDGETYSSADFEGKQAMVIAWYPKAFTGG